MKTDNQKNNLPLSPIQMNKNSNTVVSTPPFNTSSPFTGSPIMWVYTILNQKVPNFKTTFILGWRMMQSSAFQNVKNRCFPGLKGTFQIQSIFHSLWILVKKTACKIQEWTVILLLPAVGSAALTMFHWKIQLLLWPLNREDAYQKLNWIFVELSVDMVKCDLKVKANSYKPSSLR